MTNELNILVGGEAGQGVQSVGQILVKTITRSGLNIFADQDYENRVRGGHNFFRIRCGGKPVSPDEKLDLLVALNRETVDLHRGEVTDGGVIIHDGEQTGIRRRGGSYFSVPLEKIAVETGGNRVMTNTVAAGAVLGLTGFGLDLLESVLRGEFARLDKKIIEGNLAAAGAGYRYAVDNGKGLLKKNLRKKARPDGKMLLNGNESFSLGALVAGCKFISGYPMTPATPILEYFAGKGPDYGAVAVHVEDEISAVNMAIGAAFTGVRAMTATSGGGFALMVEGLSLAGITETPLVIVLAQRPGPATGMPTRTEQGELEFALHAGHGEFPRAILAPANAEDAFPTAVKAFNLAEKYQTPVIVLTDHFFATSYMSVERFDLNKVVIERGELLSDKEANKIGYKRHLLTPSGVSPRAFPMQGRGLVITDSDEHDETGHMIEAGETRIEQDLKRLKKLNGMKKEITPPGKKITPEAELILIGWGSSYGAITEAATLLNEKGVSTGVIHLSQLWPFPSEKVASALRGTAKKIVVESNATGQLGRLMRRETGIQADGNILRFDGRPLTAAYILKQLEKEVR
jgi:2-oxoglutarate ferredoxin oxidoreductase subunit alpha